LHLLASADFDMTRVPKDGATIMLHSRTPEKTGMIKPEQMQHDIGEGHTIPEEIRRDLLRRNAQPGTYDSRAAPFGGLKLDQRIVVADLTGKLGGRSSSGAFEEAYPKARGWIEAYLPGYSKDGSRAVVRAWAGPSPHGAVVTAILEKSGDKWLVKWHYLAFFA
jgi:hypothetical protein